jgi:hypothetical protein
VHLTRAGDGPWRVPEDNNPFGAFIRTPEVGKMLPEIIQAAASGSIAET